MSGSKAGLTGMKYEKVILKPSLITKPASLSDPPFVNYERLSRFSIQWIETQIN
jgi:hypothetical protein